jgi:ribosomal-protein-alanine N-acetyltransferase
MKVTIRPWTLNDAASVVKIANNRNIWNTVRDRFPYPYTETDAVHFLKTSVEKKPLENFCIEADGIVAGSIGVMLFEQNHRKNVEVGYFVGEEFWGKGLATEALRLMMPHILENFDVIRIFGVVLENNRSSMRVLEKNGFTLECIHRKASVKNDQVLDEYIWVRFNTEHPGYSATA